PCDRSAWRWPAAILSILTKIESGPPSRAAPLRRRSRAGRRGCRSFFVPFLRLGFRRGRGSDTWGRTRCWRNSGGFVQLVFEQTFLLGVNWTLLRALNIFIGRF